MASKDVITFPIWHAITDQNPMPMHIAKKSSCMIAAKVLINLCLQIWKLTQWLKIEENLGGK